MPPPHGSRNCLDSSRSYPDEEVLPPNKSVNQPFAAYTQGGVSHGHTDQGGPQCVPTTQIQFPKGHALCPITHTKSRWQARGFTPHGPPRAIRTSRPPRAIHALRDHPHKKPLASEGLHPPRSPQGDTRFASPQGDTRFARSPTQ